MNTTTTTTINVFDDSIVRPEPIDVLLSVQRVQQQTPGPFFTLQPGRDNIRDLTNEQLREVMNLARVRRFNPESLDTSTIETPYVSITDPSFFSQAANITDSSNIGESASSLSQQILSINSTDPLIRELSSQIGGLPDYNQLITSLNASAVNIPNNTESALNFSINLIRRLENSGHTHELNQFITQVNMDEYMALLFSLFALIGINNVQVLINGVLQGSGLVEVLILRFFRIVWVRGMRVTFWVLPSRIIISYVRRALIFARNFLTNRINRMHSNEYRLIRENTISSQTIYTTRALADVTAYFRNHNLMRSFSVATLLMFGASGLRVLVSNRDFLGGVIRSRAASKTLYEAIVALIDRLSRGR